ncbi:DUF123 domain-containing protein [Methanolobus sediminis]|uniref:DUF123 domain-containing protein n=1 Tax=Methanolobus sediminis TaxID=3072978 RepID=A0AA51YK33_9EURY|nr:DUF123 domain-containing protein [Methanolobus sediminis]WMW26246.1 DUF123 domain-containing protein [Methanolobus sediminis]
MQDKRDFPDISEKGVYCLIFRNGNSVLDAGSLKNIEFSKGYHVYVGSALGSGGLKRLKRHVLLSLEKNKKPRWHVDYLSFSHEFELISVIYAITDKQVECELAGRLESSFNDHIRGFGAGDCGCSSHLFYSKKRPLILIKDAFNAVELKSKVVHFV